ncbi:MAG: deaminase [Candidatus Wolfebacteria bacterium]|nr:deaminase [Candidatus Wolfebacteria bacterium]
MEKILLLYIPVIHAGYLRLIEKYQKEIEALCIVGEDFINEFCDRKEIRALDPKTVEEMLDFGSRLQVEVFTLSRANLKILSLLKGCGIITTRDELCRAVVNKYFPGQPVEYDTAFLRWDRASIFSQTPVNYDRVTTGEFDRKIMALAKGEAEKTSDWWRQVGSVVVKNGQVVYSAHNRHVPTEYQPYMVGDPRDFVKAGERSELCSAIHSEQDVIAWSAREGISLKGASLYVNVFPCPVCAKLIMASGIGKLYFAEGHASLDGEAVLKEAGVEIVLVK